jgi:hypothetical protein
LLSPEATVVTVAAEAEALSASIAQTIAASAVAPASRAFLLLDTVGSPFLQVREPGVMPDRWMVRGGGDLRSVVAVCG